MFVALAFFVFWFTNRVQVRENTISYQSFVKAVEKDQVTDVSISQNKEVPTGVLTISMDGDDTIYTVNVSDVKEAEKVLEDAKIDYELENVPQETWFSQTLAPTLIMLLGVALLYADEPAGWWSQCKGYELRKESGKNEYRSGQAGDI